MSSQHTWADEVWTDPEGGKIVIHGTLPTVVYPNAMRPRSTWHGLAILDSSDVVDMWVQEEKDEAESHGVNMTYGLISGGAFSKYLEGIDSLEDVQGGRFPDPEPRRLQRNADRHERDVFFIEPLADDEDWNDYLTQQAKAVSHWRKLLGMIRSGKRWKRSVKKNLFLAQPPPKGQSNNLSSVSVLASAWWELNEWLSTPELNHRRDVRFARRIRGALHSIRAKHGDEAVLLVVAHMPQRPLILEALKGLPEKEEISSTVTHSEGSEEE